MSIPVMPPRAPVPHADVFWIEPFEQLDAARWREVEVRGQTRYDATVLEGRPCLRARSEGGASILLQTVSFDPDTYEWLSWEWRVEQPVEGENLERKDGSDAAARVYVYFETGGLPWQKRSIDYVWSSSLPVGTVLSSAYSSASKIIVVDGGPQTLFRWRRFARNLEEDYQLCFGEKVPHVIAIGLMTDADNTKTQALAYFDELRVSRSSPVARR
jgi:hypothetical protein